MTDTLCRVPAVLVQHTLAGTGQSVRAHIVSIRDPVGNLVAEFDGAHRAARWLSDQAYRYVAGTNGFWVREAA